MDIKRKRQNMDNYFVHSQVYLTALGQWPYQSCLSLKFFRYFWIIQHISIMLPEVLSILICTILIKVATKPKITN